MFNLFLLVISGEITPLKKSYINTRNIGDKIFYKELYIKTIQTKELGSITYQKHTVKHHIDSVNFLCQLTLIDFITNLC